MKEPKVSIIIPCYNTEKFLEETLQSLRIQTYKNIEVIIVNDGSPDNLHIIAKKWEQKDSRFFYYEKENGGLASARNFGINKSEGKYIFPLDSDDYIDKTYVEKAVKILNENDSVEVVYSKVRRFGESNELFKLPKFTLKELLIKNIIISAAFFRKSSFVKVKGYCEQLKSLEDWDLWISLLKNGGEVYEINEELFFYRKRKEGSLINNLYNDLEKYKQYHDIIIKRHLDAFLEHVGNPFFIKRELDRLKEEKNKSIKLKTISFFKKIYTNFLNK